MCIRDRNEIAAAISDDPAFFTTMATANTTLQANITALSTAAATARTALQTALQANIDAEALTGTNARGVLSGRLDSLELDPVTKTYVDAAVTNLIDAAPGVLNTLNEIAAALGDDENFATTVTNNIATVQADVDANEAASDVAEAALSARLDTLEADPTTATALAAVQSDVDANETASDAAETALSGRLDTLEADPTTATAVAAVQTDVDANQVTAANAVTAQNTAMLAAVAVVQADVDQNETDADTAIAAVQADVDANETAAAALVTAENTAMLAAVAVVQADVDGNESDADTAIALKANKAGDTFTGDIIIDEGTGSTIKLETSDATSAGIHIEGPSGSMGYIDTTNGFGNDSLQVYSANFWLRSINGGTGNLLVDGTIKLLGGLTDAANDSAAASAGVAVSQLYRNGSIVMIRVS